MKNQYLKNEQDLKDLGYWLKCEQKWEKIGYKNCLKYFFVLYSYNWNEGVGKKIKTGSQEFNSGQEKEAIKFRNEKIKELLNHMKKNGVQ